MSKVRRDQARTKLQNALAIAPPERFLQMIWALDALQSGRADLASKAIEFPEGADIPGLDNPLAIHPWELETLVNQLFSTKYKAGPRYYPCMDFNTGAEFTNKLRDLGDAEYVLTSRPEAVLSELHRIGQRQFPWQRGGINLPDFYRPLYLYGQGSSAQRFRDAYGLSVSQFALLGFALFTVFTKQPYTNGNLNFDILGLTDKEIAAGLNLITIAEDSARAALVKLVRQTGSQTWPVAYKPSILRRFPLILMDRAQGRLRAPIPILIIQRVTFGLYYDLLSLGGDLRNEVADRFEQYVADLIPAMAPAFSASREYAYRGSRKGITHKSPDVIVSYKGRASLLIECKATKLTFAAQFSDNPVVDARQRYEEIGKGVYQLWRFYAHSRLGLTRHSKADEAQALLLTLDTWLVVSRELQDDVLAIAHSLADADTDILKSDRRPVVFCAVQDLEHILSKSDEESILSIIEAASEERFLGWLLPNIRRELPAAPELTKKYPFNPDALLPWWGKLKPGTTTLAT